MALSSLDTCMREAWRRCLLVVISRSHSNGLMVEAYLTLPWFSHPCDAVLYIYMQTCVRGGILGEKRWS